MVLHFISHSFPNAQKKITGTVFRKNPYASQLAPVIFFPQAVLHNVALWFIKKHPAPIQAYG